MRSQSFAMEVQGLLESHWVAMEEQEEGQVDWADQGRAARMRGREGSGWEEIIRQCPLLSSRQVIADQSSAQRGRSSSGVPPTTSQGRSWTSSSRWQRRNTGTTRSRPWACSSGTSMTWTGPYRTWPTSPPSLMSGAWRTKCSLSRLSSSMARAFIEFDKCCLTRV